MKRLSYGFTLIELIVTVAIIGVLSVSLISLLNPLEMIARANDAGRLSMIKQLSGAMQSYLLINNTSLYPNNTATGWQSSILLPSGAIKSVASVTGVPGTNHACGGASSTYTNPMKEGNICYRPYDANAEAYIWTAMESRYYRDKITEAAAAAGDTCTGYYSFAWRASEGRIGLLCSANSGDPEYVTAHWYPL